MRQEGRGIGFHNKLRAYSSSRTTASTPSKRTRPSASTPTAATTASACRSSLDLGLQQDPLLTNNPAKRAGLEGYGLEVVERVPIMATPNQHNWRYLETKRDKLGHFIDMPG